MKERRFNYWDGSRAFDLDGTWLDDPEESRIVLFISGGDIDRVRLISNGTVEVLWWGGRPPRPNTIVQSGDCFKLARGILADDGPIEPLLDALMDAVPEFTAFIQRFMELR